MELCNRCERIHRKLGISPALATIVLVVAAVAIAVAVFALSGGMVMSFGAGSKVVIERVDVLVNPSTGEATITVDVRNAGGQALSNCSVNVSGKGLSATSLTGPTNLSPGNVGSYTKTGVSGLIAGEFYTATVTCKDPGGRDVSDSKQAIAHI